jgi:hypothetical protein
MKEKNKKMKTLLFILIFFIGLTATLSGLLLIGNFNGKILNVPITLLDGAPFKNSLIPALLLIVIGAVNILAAIYNIRKHPSRYNLAMAGGFMICGWIITQMILIPAAHWQHYLYLVTGILIILTAYQLKGKWAA